MSQIDCTRRWRARRRGGYVCLPVELPSQEAGSALVALGFLAPLDVSYAPDGALTVIERNALQRAVQAFIDSALLGLEPLS